MSLHLESYFFVHCAIDLNGKLPRTGKTAEIMKPDSFQLLIHLWHKISGSVTLKHILLKAYALYNSERIRELGCLRCHEKLSKKCLHIKGRHQMPYQSIHLNN